MVTEIKYAKSAKQTDTSNPASAVKICAKDDRKLDSCVKAAFSQIIKKDYLLPNFRGQNPVRVVAISVCGRNRVRIRSCPAKELLPWAHESLGAQKPKKTVPWEAIFRKPES
jgi:hypothetical protein